VESHGLDQEVGTLEVRIQVEDRQVGHRELQGSLWEGTQDHQEDHRDQ